MPLAVIKTNLAGVDHSFAAKLEDFIVSLLNSDPALTMVEIHTGLLMSRNQSQAPMLNMEFHHNEEAINALTKKEHAARFAGFVQQELHIPVPRILVLFFDTRCTTFEATAL